MLLFSPNSLELSPVIHDMLPTFPSCDALMHRNAKTIDSNRYWLVLICSRWKSIRGVTRQSIMQSLNQSSQWVNESINQ
jgi:hypothetical protein